MKEANSVSILGCGWLGLPLAQHLIANGYGVKGSTTSAGNIISLKNAGLIPYQLHFNTDSPVDSSLIDFSNSEILVIAVPPGRTEEKKLGYQRIFTILKELIPSTPIKQVVLVSSTSVYGEHHAEVSEETNPQPVEPSGIWMREIEILAENLPVSVCIVRMAGLIGPGRHPGRFFMGKKDIPNGLVPVNLIYLDDAVKVIAELIKIEAKGVYNACAPSHPSRQEFYTLATQQLGQEAPEFKSNSGPWKKVNCKKLEELHFEFIYPDLMALYRNNPR